MKALILSFFLVGVLHADELSSSEIQAQKDGLVYWSQFADQVGSSPRGEVIEKLATGIVKTSRHNMFSIPETAGVANKLRVTMLAIPGHAKYYQDKIDAMRAEVLANVKKSNDEIERMRADHTIVEYGDYEDFRGQAFPVLGMLPSSETVAVLGHFLNDPEGLDGTSFLGRARGSSDFLPFPANAEAAAISIRRLGIEKPPFRTAGERDYFDVRNGEIDAWKDWWNEVKDGTRTYRFIGSSIDYGPDGPAFKDEHQPIRQSLKSGRENDAGQIISPRFMTIPVILAAFALCAAAVWAYLRSKSNSPSR